MLQPKRTKFRKTHRGRMRGLAQRGNSVAFGEYGLKSTSVAWVTSRQIESARRAIVRHLRRGGGGKGPVDQWVAVVKPGRIMFEVGGVAAETAQEALRKAGQKLPLRTRTVKRLDEVAAS